MKEQTTEIDRTEFNSKYLLKEVIPEIAQRHPMLKKALSSPRLEGGLNDVEIAFYAGGVPKKLGKAIDNATLAVDIVLRNHHVSLKTRKTIIEEIRSRASLEQY